jgi:predicted O-methyltransferase YrrM
MDSPTSSGVPTRPPGGRPVDPARVFADVDVAGEDEVLLSARARAEELGCVALSARGGAALRLLVGIAKAKSVVEVGTGTGVSGLWILRGMRQDGVLTSIDPEPEYQRAARLAFKQDGVPASRVRLINGWPREVLPRLTDGYYDAVLVLDAPRAEYLGYLTEALRLLRPGGLVAFDRMAPTQGSATDGAVIRTLIRTIRDHPDLLPALLPVSDGLLVALRR